VKAFDFAALRAAVLNAEQDIERTHQAMELLGPAPEPAPELPAVRMARDALDEVRIACLLGEATPEEEAKAVQSLQQAEAAQRSVQEAPAKHEALMDGMRRRLQRAEAERDTAAEALHKAEAECQAAWCQSQMQEAEKVYVEHGIQAAHAMYRVQALAGFLQQLGKLSLPIDPSRRTLELPVIGYAGLAAAEDATPWTRGKSEAWTQDIARPPEPSAARAALQQELEALVTPPSVANDGAQQGASVAAAAARGLKNLVRRAAG